MIAVVAAVSLAALPGLASFVMGWATGLPRDKKK